MDALPNARRLPWWHDPPRRCAIPDLYVSVDGQPWFQLALPYPSSDSSLRIKLRISWLDRENAPVANLTSVSSACQHAHNCYAHLEPGGEDYMQIVGPLDPAIWQHPSGDLSLVVSALRESSARGRSHLICAVTVPRASAVLRRKRAALPSSPSLLQDMAICTRVVSETIDLSEAFLLEWLLWHFSRGVSQVHLYVQSSAEHLALFLRELSAHPGIGQRVRVVDWRPEASAGFTAVTSVAGQFLQIRDCYLTNHASFRYVMHLDTDEFIDVQQYQQHQHMKQQQEEVCQGGSLVSLLDQYFATSKNTAAYLPSHPLRPYPAGILKDLGLADEGDSFCRSSRPMASLIDTLVRGGRGLECQLALHADKVVMEDATRCRAKYVTSMGHSCAWLLKQGIPSRYCDNPAFRWSEFGYQTHRPGIVDTLAPLQANGSVLGRIFHVRDFLFQALSGSPIRSLSDAFGVQLDTLPTSEKQRFDAKIAASLHQGLTVLNRQPPDLAHLLRAEQAISARFQPIEVRMHWSCMELFFELLHSNVSARLRSMHQTMIDDWKREICIQIEKIENK